MMNDPKELKNIASEQPKIAAEMYGELFKFSYPNDGIYLELVPEIAK